VDLDMDHVTTLGAAVLLGIGFVLQQYSAGQEPESRFLRLRILTDLLGKPRWLLGIGCMVAGDLLAAWSIGHLELTLVEPLLVTYLVWALVLAVPMSRQAVRLTEVTGALILIGGVTLVSVTRSTTPAGLSFGSFSHWYAAAIIAGIAFAAGRAVGCQKSACSVTCSDGSQPYGIMVTRVPAPALSHLRPALRLAGPARPVIGL
jgi:hypothetical protein